MMDDYKKLVALFLLNAQALEWDGAVDCDGTVKVGSFHGSLLTNENVLDSLHKREDATAEKRRRQEISAAKRMERAKRFAERSFEKERKHARRQ